MQQPHHLPPTAAALQAGMPHLASPKGISGLPVALGGTASVTRPNGLHPSHMLLGPSPLVAMPPTSLAPHLTPALSAQAAAAGLLLPPHAHSRLPQPPIASLAAPAARPHDAMAAMTSQASGFGSARSSSRGSNAEYEQRAAHVRSKSPPASADRGARDSTSPPAAKRARSGSPLQVTEDSDGESQRGGSDESEPVDVVDKEIHRSKIGTV